MTCYALSAGGYEPQHVPYPVSAPRAMPCLYCTRPCLATAALCGWLRRLRASWGKHPGVLLDGCNGKQLDGGMAAAGASCRPNRVALPAPPNPGASAQFLVSGMVGVWALRLGSYLVTRVVKTGKDARFDGVRDNPPKFFVYWTMQVGVGPARMSTYAAA